MPIQITGGDPNARAAVAADVRYGAKQSALERAIQALSGSQRAAEQGLQTYGTAGRQGITQSFDQLAGNLETNRQLVNRDLGIQTEAVGQGYRDANVMAEAARSEAIDRLTSMYNSNPAYATASLSEAATPIESLAARIVGDNARTDASYTGNLKNWAAQQDSLMRMGQAGAERDRANRMSSFENELLRRLAESQNEYAGREVDLQGGLLDLLTERGSFEAGAAADFVDQLFGQQLQAGQLNLQESELASNNAYRQAQLQQAAQQFAHSSDLANRELSLKEIASRATNNDDYWAALKHDLEVDKLNSLNNRSERDFLGGQTQKQRQEALEILKFLDPDDTERMNALYDSGLIPDPRPAQLQAAANAGASQFGKDIFKTLTTPKNNSGFDVSMLNPFSTRGYTPLDPVLGLSGLNPIAGIRTLRKWGE